VTRSKAGADPSAEDRDDYEQSRAHDERSIGRDAAYDKVAQEEARQQRVGYHDKSNREQIAASDTAKSPRFKVDAVYRIVLHGGIPS